MFLFGKKLLIKLVQLSPAGADPGLLALNPASIFEKLLDQKTSLPPAALLKCDEFHSGKSLSDVFKK